jgi:RNA polymerase I-specific transcription initiation factor RRN7
MYWIGDHPFADMFPLKRVNEGAAATPVDDEQDAISQKLHAALADLAIRRAVPDDSSMPKTIARPGSNYRRYRSEEMLDEKAGVLYEAAAKTIGVSVKTMVQAVYQAEQKIRVVMGQTKVSGFDQAFESEDENLNVGGDESMEDVET